MYRSILFAICAISALTASSGSVFAQAYNKVAGEISVLTDKLIAISNAFSSDIANFKLSDSDYQALNAYATQPAAYRALSAAQRGSLSQIINLSPDIFGPNTVSSFNAQQQQMAGLTATDISNLKDIISDIQSGKKLTDSQVGALKGYQSSMLEAPFAFLPELPEITVYASLNTDQFSPNEINAYRTAIAQGVGITQTQLATYADIAARGNTALNTQDTEALKILMLKASIGSIAALDPDVSNRLDSVIVANGAVLPAGQVATWNKEFNKNTAIKQTATPKTPLNRANVQKSSPRVQQKGPSSSAQRGRS